MPMRRELDVKPLLFVHIPKTAGTSFNENAERHFGPDAVEKDYGTDAAHTSALVKTHIYGPKTIDQYGFHQAFIEADKKWLTGHFNADRYLHLMGCDNTIAFVRDPVERVVSEYLYRKRQFGMDRPLEDFYCDPGETNKQYRMIGQYPWQALRFVGTHARYNDCLEIINKTFGLTFGDIQSNRRNDGTHLDISENDKTEIRRWNERDCYFYEEAVAYLEKQFTAASLGQPFCHHNIGFSAGNHAIGWAFYPGEDSAVEVGLFVDGQLTQKNHASEHITELQAIGAPRSGNVGFRFVLDDHNAARTIELKALDTEQALFTWAAEAATNS